MAAHLVHLFSLCLIVAIAVNSSPITLKPLPRRHWYEPEHERPSWFKTHHHNGHYNKTYWPETQCNGNNTATQISFDLQGDEQLVWGSPNEGTNAIVASVLITPYPGQLIIDAGRFSSSLTNSTCSYSNILLRFSQRSFFAQAQRLWDWVNQDTQRTFVLVADQSLCNSGLDRDPWVITHATFFPATLEIQLDATKKYWTDVIYEYQIDFGAAEHSVSQKRASIFDYGYERAFEIPLTTTLGPKLFDFTVNDPVNGATGVQFGVNCIDCGLFGRLRFVGHIKGNLLLGVEQFDIGLASDGIRAALNLEFLFSGRWEPGMYGLSNLEKTFPHFDIPLPNSWKIDGIIDLGPKVKVQTAIKVASIEGKARLTTGCSVTVPDNSIARLDFRSEDLFQVEGWIPSFEVQPIDLDAQMNAVVEVSMQYIPAFDFVVLKQRGARAGIPISLPNVKVNIKAGEDPNGFCPGDPSPYGVKVQTTLGLKVAAVAVVERSAAGLLPLSSNVKNKVLLFEKAAKPEISVNTKPLVEVIEQAAPVLTKKPASRSLTPRAVSLEKGEITILDKEIFDPPGFPIDDWCRTLPGGTCPLYKPEMDDRDWYEAEINSPNDGDSDILDKRAMLVPRGDRTMSFKCGSSATPCKIKNYPGPTKLKRRMQREEDLKFPIIVPGIKRCQNPCLFESWGVKVEHDPALIVIESGKGEWSADHVYEVNWLAKFWQHLAEDRGLLCPNTHAGVATIDTRLLQIGTAGGFADKLLSKVGNSQTYKDTMTLFPIDLNGLKHRMFAGKTLYADSAVQKQDANLRACSIGRIVTTCRYMAEGTVQSRLKNTLAALDAVFAEMDETCNVLRLPGANSYLVEHRKWFSNLYANGIKNARRTIKRYAELMLKDPDGFQDLKDPATRNAITRISKLNLGGNWDEFCPNPFEYPNTDLIQEGFKSDPKNCGQCGKVCSDGQTCKAGECAGPSPPDNPPDNPPENPNTFPQTVTPTEGLISDWDLSLWDEPFNDVYSYYLDKGKFLEIGGKLTLNTRCLAVSEFENTGGRLPADATFTWDRDAYDGVDDTCCLAVFPGTSCSASQRREFCETSMSYKMPFDVKSFLVYGCHGLKIEH